MRRAALKEGEGPLYFSTISCSSAAGTLGVATVSCNCEVLIPLVPPRRRKVPAERHPATFGRYSRTVGCFRYQRSS